MDRITEAAVESINGAEGAVVELMSGDDLVYVAVAGNLLAYQGLRLKIADSLSGQAIRTRTTLWCRNTEADERVDRDACRRIGVRSMVVVPLWQDDHPVGVLKVSSSTIESFTRQDVSALDGLADDITQAITHSTDLSAITDAFPSDPPDPPDG